MPALTRAQAIKQTYQLAHQSSLIARDVTCHSVNEAHRGHGVESGWVCE